MCCPRWTIPARSRRRPHAVPPKAPWAGLPLGAPHPLLSGSPDVPAFPSLLISTVLGIGSVSEEALQGLPFPLGATLRRTDIRVSLWT